MQLHRKDRPGGVASDHPELDLTQVRILLVEPRERLLGAFSTPSSDHALQQLRDRGVDVRLRTGVARAEPGHVELTDGERVATRTLIWAAGVAASPLASTLGVPLTAGRRVPVDHHLRALGLRDVFAIGDLAGSADRDGDLLQLVGFDNRARVLASWIWNYVAVDHAARLILDQREAERVETGRGWVRRTSAA